MSSTKKQMDNACESQLLLYIVWFNTICFGLTRSNLQVNKTHNKLLRKLHTTISRGIPASQKRKKKVHEKRLNQ